MPELRVQAQRRVPDLRLHLQQRPADVRVLRRDRQRERSAARGSLAARRRLAGGLRAAPAGRPRLPLLHGAPERSERPPSGADRRISRQTGMVQENLQGADNPREGRFTAHERGPVHPADGGPRLPRAAVRAVPRMRPPGRPPRAVPVEGGLAPGDRAVPGEPVAAEKQRERPVSAERPGKGPEWARLS